MIEQALLTAALHDETDIDVDTGEVTAHRRSMTSCRLEATITGADLNEVAAWLHRLAEQVARGPGLDADVTYGPPGEVWVTRS